jgi:hypothetical protein
LEDATSSVATVSESLDVDVLVELLLLAGVEVVDASSPGATLVALVVLPLG